MAMMTGQGDWRSDFAAAMALSTAAVMVLTGLLTIGGLPQPVAFSSDQRSSITSCLISDDGKSVVLSYWQPDHGHESPRRGIAALSLCEAGSRMQAIPTPAQPWRLARVGSRTCYAADAAGQMVLRPVDGEGRDNSHSISLPTSCTSEFSGSPDGKTLIAWVLGKLQVFDVEQQSVRWQREGDVDCYAYDARHGLFAAVDSRIVELSLESGAILRTVASGCERLRTLAVTPGGASLAWLDWNGVIGMLRICDGELIWRQADHAAGTLPVTHRPVLYSRVLTFSSDGRYLATAAREGEWVLAVWNARTGVRVRTLRGHDNNINGAAFLPDGSLGSWSADGTLRLWNVRRGAVRRIFRAQDLPPLNEPPAGTA